MSQFIKYYKKQILKNFFKIPVWLLKIIFPLRRLKIRGSKIDFQSYAYINLNPKSTLYTIEDKDLPKIRKIIESNKIKSNLSLNPKIPVKTKDHFIYSKSSGAKMLLREYIPNIANPQKTILFFHGGGWTIDSVETYNDMIKYFSDYLKYNLEQNFNKQSLGKILNIIGKKPSDALRKNEEIWKKHLNRKNIGEDEILELMIQYPKLIERPIVVYGNKGVIARPLENLIDFINNY